MISECSLISDQRRNMMDASMHTIQDAGLRHLEALKPLEVLLLAGFPKVTDAGVARLKKALPRCDIHR
jgi:hypothetical protein